jgi:hypothetical protein
MKLLILIPLLISLNILAQPNSNSILLGTRINYSSTNTSSTLIYAYGAGARQDEETEKENSTNLNFQGGFFITKRILVGLGYGLERNQWERFFKTTDFYSNYGASLQTTEKSTINANNLNVFMRYHIWLSPKCGIFFEPRFAYGEGKAKYKVEPISGDLYFMNTGFESYTESKILSVNIRPGIIYFIKDWIALDASIGNFGYQKTESIGISEEVFVQMGVETFTFGLNFILNNKHKSEIE